MKFFWKQIVDYSSVTYLLEFTIRRSYYLIKYIFRVVKIYRIFMRTCPCSEFFIIQWPGLVFNLLDISYCITTTTATNIIAAAVKLLLLPPLLLRRFQSILKISCFIFAGYCWSVFFFTSLSLYNSSLRPYNQLRGLNESNIPILMFVWNIHLFQQSLNVGETLCVISNTMRGNVEYIFTCAFTYKRKKNPDNL